MANYLIEVPHRADKMACMKAIQVFVESGSHFLANADWGCSDNEHKAWLIVDVENKEQARQIIPPLYRKDAKITALFKVTNEEVEQYRKERSLSETDKFHI